LLYYLIVEFAHDPRFAELLAEPLTEEEVRDLLERLGSKEFGGPENATVNSVVEATGASVDTVGNLLAQIRKEDFEERFGLRLDHHENRIETLEERALRLEVLSRPPPVQVPTSGHALDPYQQRALDRLANQERQSEAMRPIALVIGAIVLAMMCFSGALCNTTNVSQASDPKVEGTIIGPVNAGNLVWGPDETILVKVKADGSTRLPTKAEVQKFGIYDAKTSD
jgi:hypothetical protein